MGRIIEIESLCAPELRAYAGLTEPQLKNREGLFIAEGLKVIENALAAGVEPVSMLMERRHIAGKAAALVESLDVPVYTAEDAELEKLTGFRLSRGVLCCMKRPKERDALGMLASARRVAALEHVGDPTNIGAIMRSAAALGMDAVLLSPDCCDPLNRRAVRVSMGTVFQVPWAVGDFALLRQAGFKTVALALREDTIDITDPRLPAEERLALALGAEGDGLRDDTIAACDFCAKIPMRPGVDSLNVAAAAAVACWVLGRRM